MVCGALGTVTGLIHALAAAAGGKIPEPASVVVMIGTSESLHNLDLALIFLAMSLIISADGALRIWRGQGGQ